MKFPLKSTSSRVSIALTGALAIIAFNASSALAAPLSPLAGLFGGFGSLLGGSATVVCEVDATRGIPALEALMNGSHVRARTSKGGAVHELARLTIPPSGTGITGTLFHESLEGCTLPVTGGTLTLNGSGVGKLAIVLNVGATVTDQGDLPCNALFGGQTTLTENFNAVSSPTAGRIDLVGEENYIPPPGGVALVPVRGDCVRQ